MMYRSLPYLLATCAVLCAPLPAFSQSNAALMDRLDRMERDLTAMQRQVYRGGAKGGAPVGDAAGLEVQLSAMQEQVQRLNGRIETLEHQLAQTTKRLEQITKDNEFRFQDLEKRVNQPPVLPPPGGAAGEANLSPQPVTPPAPRVNTLDEAQAEPEGDEAAADTDTDTVQPLKVKREPKPDASGKYHFDNPVDQYNHAFKMLNQARFDDARDLLADFVGKYPSDPLIGNAYYWLGEVYYVKRDYEAASSNFRQGYEKLPGGPKAPDNLLKLGMSLTNLGQKDKACTVLKSVQTKFPKASDNIRKTTAAELKRAGC